MAGQFFQSTNQAGDCHLIRGTRRTTRKLNIRPESNGSNEVFPFWGNYTRDVPRCQPSLRFGKGCNIRCVCFKFKPSGISQGLSRNIGLFQADLKFPAACRFPPQNTIRARGAAQMVFLILGRPPWAPTTSSMGYTARGEEGRMAGRSVLVPRVSALVEMDNLLTCTLPSLICWSENENFCNTWAEFRGHVNVFAFPVCCVI